MSARILSESKDSKNGKAQAITMVTFENVCTFYTLEILENDRDEMSSEEEL